MVPGLTRWLFPHLECEMRRVDTLSNWQSPHSGSLITLLVASILSTEIINEKHCGITMEIVEIHGTVKDLKETGMVTLIVFPFSFSCLACEVLYMLENDYGVLST